MRQRNSGVAADGQRGGDARHDFIGNPGRLERGDFFGRVRKDDRVAPFEPHDGPPLRAALRPVGR